MQNYKTQKGFVVPLVIAIVAMLALGGVVYFIPNKKAEAPIVINPNVPGPVSTTTGTSNSTFVYTNTKYGFTLNFPQNWKKYFRVTQTSENTFEFGTSPENKIEADVVDTDSNTFLSGIPVYTTGLFDIQIYSHADWNNYVGKKYGNDWKYLGENNKYVFAWGIVPGYTEDQIPLVNQVKTIVSTFKLINTLASTTTPITGNDKDIHGCIGSAGYLWCAEKSKCIRPWEEKCEVVATSTDKVQCKTDNDCMEVSCPGTGGFAHEMCFQGRCIFAPGVKERCTAQPSCNCPSNYIKEGDTCTPKCYYSTPKCLMPSIMCSRNIEVATTTNPIACTMDAMQCPDGSYVGRTGPKCEFVCPIVDENVAKINQNILINGLSITPLEVLSDSRCATDVVCVWAGTVTLRVNLESNNIKDEVILTLNKPFVFSDKQITLSDVIPIKKHTEIILLNEYSFKFLVDKVN